MATTWLPSDSAGPYAVLIGPVVADMPPVQLQKHLISIAFPLTPRRIDMIFPRLATASYRNSIGGPRHSPTNESPAARPKRRSACQRGDPKPRSATDRPDRP